MNSETAYLLRHALLRDGAYQLQLPGDRARLHRLAFKAIEGPVAQLRMPSQDPAPNLSASPAHPARRPMPRVLLRQTRLSSCPRARGDARRREP
ncbi:MAG: hypothetical protein FD180_4842 [Planctomycetota bacterium]|nr:MAG: hypothetical protein FD180_4842 [Planctomycetota bacterium]